MKSIQLIDINQFPDYCIDNKALLELSRKLTPTFQDIVNQDNLGDEVINQLDKVYLPLCAWIASKHSAHPIVIGINGAQGSGKSTLSKILVALLREGFGKSAIQISIDDLYFSKAKRNLLAESIHPLLKVRGVPGTHDVDLGINILERLTTNKNGKHVLLPVFDKSIDDLLPKEKWKQINNNVDIILFEGWCVGSKPENVNDLQKSINKLEENKDKNKEWRIYVNQQLATYYQKLFKYLDYLIMLKVPDMESIFNWRALQENKLRKMCEEEGDIGVNIMSDDEIREFIMYFERITRHTLKELPGRADLVLMLDNNHQISNVRVNE